jgi:hypothetical protein
LSIKMWLREASSIVGIPRIIFTEDNEENEEILKNL